MSDHSPTAQSPTAQAVSQHNLPSNALPKRILWEKWSVQGFEWCGAVAVGDFERLGKLVSEPYQSKDAPTLWVKVHLHRDTLVWLDVHLRGALWFACHRCNEAVKWAFDHKYKLAIVQDESELLSVTTKGDKGEPDDGQDDVEQDHVLWQEVAVEGRWLPLGDLIEDELLLLLPLQIVHDDCLPSVVSKPTVKENPFAILSSLKLGGKQ